MKTFTMLETRYGKPLEKRVKYAEQDRLVVEVVVWGFVWVVVGVGV